MKLDLNCPSNSKVSIFCRSGVIEWIGDYKNLKEKVAYEAQNLNMLKEKVAKLPL